MAYNYSVMNTKNIVIAVIAVVGLGTIIALATLRTRPIRITAEAANSNAATNSDSNEIRYLPLGDSYTIGESVNEADRWPNQLATRLTTGGKQLKIIANPSVTGYTTQNLIDRELPLIPKLRPDFVTILIGVNDYVQGVNAATFSQRLDYIISTTQKQLQNPGNIVLVTIPDYGKTPTGSRYGSPESSERGITAFNKIIAQAGAKYNLPVADIFAVSQKVSSDPTLTADDGLHPSAKQYTEWTNIILQTFTTNKLPK